MNPCSIVVLSGYPDVFVQFRQSADAWEPVRRKILVTSRGMAFAGQAWTVIAGVEPFAFPRNANIGIRAAGTDDVLLVNDDVQFLTSNTVAMLQKVAHSDDSIGVLSPQFIGQVGNPLQKNSTRLSGSVTFTDDRLAFTCVYLKRSTIDRVGLLDERFDGWGCDDDDYCKRVRDAFLHLAVTPCAVVKHGFAGRPSASFARVPNVEASAEAMRVKFAEKHGYRP